MNKFLLGMIASFGIMEADLPDVATWMLVILIVCVVIRWHSGDSLKRISLHVLIAEVIGGLTFATHWDNIYVIGSFPDPAIAMFVGVVASYPLQFIERIKNFKIKGN